MAVHCSCLCGVPSSWYCVYVAQCNPPVSQSVAPAQGAGGAALRSSQVVPIRGPLCRLLQLGVAPHWRPLVLRMPCSPLLYSSANWGRCGGSARPCPAVLSHPCEGSARWWQCTVPACMVSRPPGTVCMWLNVTPQSVHACMRLRLPSMPTLHLAPCPLVSHLLPSPPFFTPSAWYLILAPSLQGYPALCLMTS